MRITAVFLFLLFIAGCSAQPADTSAKIESPISPTPVVVSETPSPSPTPSPVVDAETGCTAPRVVSAPKDKMHLSSFVLEKCGEITDYPAYKAKNTPAIMYAVENADSTIALHVISTKAPFKDFIAADTLPSFSFDFVTAYKDHYFVGYFADAPGMAIAITVVDLKGNYVHASHVAMDESVIAVRGSASDKVYRARTEKFDIVPKDTPPMRADSFKTRYFLPNGTEAVVRSDEMQSGKHREVAPMFACIFPNPAEDDVAKQAYVDHFPNQIPCHDDFIRGSKPIGVIDLKKQQFISK